MSEQRYEVEWYYGKWRVFDMRRNGPNIMCDCDEEADANLIASALNAQAERDALLDWIVKLRRRRPTG